METTLDEPFRVDRLSAGEHEIHVLRDDLLPGGSKQRACRPYLQVLMEKGASHFVYASPFAGFAQVALAQAANELGARCTLFCEEDKTVSANSKPHAFSLLAGSHGADVRVVRSLEEAEERSESFARQQDAFKVPLGFNDPVFNRELESAISRLWPKICDTLARPIERIWVPVGSGTLGRALSRVLRSEMSFVWVDVGVLPAGDPRVVRLMSLPNATYLRAPEHFAAAREIPPPVPSNRHYDSKLWRFIRERASPGDLWWNVAR